MSTGCLCLLAICAMCQWRRVGLMRINAGENTLDHADANLIEPPVCPMASVTVCVALRVAGLRAAVQPVRPVLLALRVPARAPLLQPARVLHAAQRDHPQGARHRRLQLDLQVPSVEPEPCCQRAGVRDRIHHLFLLLCHGWNTGTGKSGKKIEIPKVC